MFMVDVGCKNETESIVNCWESCEIVCPKGHLENVINIINIKHI